MPIYWGGCQIDKLMLGTCEVSKAYLGDCDLFDSGPPSPVFHALAPDETGLMQGVLIGTGGLTEAAATQIWALGADGYYGRFDPGKPSYYGGRFAGTPGSLQVFEDEGQTVYLQYAPQATNDVNLESADPSLWSTHNSITSAQDAVWMDGTANQAWRGTAQAASCWWQDAGALSLNAGETNTLVLRQAVESNSVRQFLGTQGGTYFGEFDNVSVAPGTFGGGATASAIRQEGAGLISAVQFDVSTTENRVCRCGMLQQIGDQQIHWNVEMYRDTPIAVAQYLPPIVTAGAPLSRQACALSFDAANHNDTIGTYSVDVDAHGPGALLGNFLSHTGTHYELTDGTNTASIALAPGKHTIGCVYGDGTMALYADGAWSADVPYDGTLHAGDLTVCPGSAYPTGLRHLKRWSVKDKGLLP